MRIRLWLFAVLFGGFITSCGTSQPAAGTESYIAPGYKKQKYSNILILGTMKDIVGRKKAETALADLMNRSGYKGTATYNTFSLADIHSKEELKAVIEPLKFDGIIVLEYMGASTQISDKTTLSSTTPLTSWNFFDLYTSPAYDFNYETTTQKQGRVLASFYTREKYEKQWSSGIQLSMNDGLEMATEKLAGTVLARMMRDKIL
ncbi:hypothetical protein [Flavihumibacter profundi]|uniref:hypothetical protein n=1 Tax=Flavihumibacter profundi TaxID=2716883 RepID=UPI001CC5E3D5|nr:hypothetical protein [Flavihumibacter profundi]MBZ5859203.1 hypothetical protein [Flavihumibacter profundi]